MTAEVRGHLPKDPSAIVLLLHGGGEEGETPVTWWMPPVLRMLPFAWAIRRTAGRRVGVVRLKNEKFGWNGAERSPMTGARWALSEIRRQRPGAPIVLVGHSMGGRVALNLMDEPDVVAVAALAPWIVAADGVHGHAGQHALLMHGLDDNVTDPRLTERYAAELRERGVDVQWAPVEGEGHAMLRRATRWHRDVARFITDTVRATKKTAS